MMRSLFARGRRTRRLRSTLLATLPMLGAFAFALGACAARGAGDPVFLTPYGPPVNPFSPAVRAGNLLYLAGQIGTDSTGTVVKGGIDAEARQTMKNIAAVLDATGSSMERVVKCTVFMADMKEWPAMNVVYASFFPTHKPARSALGANGLALGARVEIECIAMAGRK
jgi:2-iminobutanoate/2-iminopropanoate deaminase